MKHLAIIADGNRRWAKKNDLSIEAGYLQGFVGIENCCDWAIQTNVPYLSVFVFSTENWGRHQEQVDLMMNLARVYFAERKDWYVAMNIKIVFSGRKDRLPKDLIEDMEVLSERTKGFNRLVLTIYVDYGGRDEIARAVSSGATTEQEIDAVIYKDTPAPDAILRTGGECRLSNFMLWQAAYAELFFSPVLFPEVEETFLNGILNEYHKRTRNYGK